MTRTHYKGWLISVSRIEQGKTDTYYRGLAHFIKYHSPVVPARLGPHIACDEQTLIDALKREIDEKIPAEEIPA